MVFNRWGITALVVVVGFVGAIGGERYASHLEQDNNFCGSCHTQPETEYLARFASAVAQSNAQDVAAFHHRKKDVKCIDCHTGEGVVGRGEVFSLATWDALKHYTGIQRQPATIVVPVQNEACTKCHQETMALVGFNNHEHNKMLDSAAPFIRCTDCHLAHRLGDESNAFQFRDAILPKCEYCHVQMGRGPTKGLVK
jgi:nitrate/TMAO reductase-like tetraheme cytochrome c subunit